MSERIDDIRAQAVKWTALPLDAPPDLPEQIIRTLLAEIDRLNEIIELARPVLQHVSRGRRAAFIDPYPDATARKALGAISD